MLFNSYEFAIFLPLVFILYWFAFQKSLRLQNLFIILVSYLFYGWWDWRFLFLVLFSSSLDFWVGLRLDAIEDPRWRKVFFSLSYLTNLGFLGFFKYYNFFAESLTASFARLGVHLDPTTLYIILPVGISFYTFQTLSYTIDVYRRKLSAEKDPVVFFAFVSFFPQLVAGPIERATHLLPQFQHQRHFDSQKARDGLRQMLWGFFKKMVVADNCAKWVGQIFGDYQHQTSSALIAGSILFTFQIYGDFSGYSDIAIGSARLFGFDLIRNFAYPYFSRDIAEFWRRWHISLSNWFRDYVYIPLGGSRVSTYKVLRNTFVIFVLSGLWHGANWTYVAWGFLHAVYLLPLVLMKRNRNNLEIVAAGRTFPSLKELIQMLSTFALVSFALIFFRSKDIHSAFGYIAGMFKTPFLPFNRTLDFSLMTPVFIALMLLVEWAQRTKQHGLQMDHFASKPLRWSIYLAVFLIIFVYGAAQQTFIYFQF
ncbi:MBOAT family O-acyltransferase [Taibaiella soli]|uniref:MBOAT family protein n=1 Tax=Taibaiella soli TaxID=1649169 RepID=A0A2W2B3U5_9BACT|nr:MBOAT family O-acyltransferase [Taibaiella soli]PZF74708.1 MBOAT family protein [Taibaiella soli]